MKVKISKAHQPQIPMSIDLVHMLIIGHKFETVSLEKRLTSSNHLNYLLLHLRKTRVAKNLAIN